MATPSRKHRFIISTFALAVFWLGLAIGVSFLATPAKFLAPSLPLPVALDVGRHTFAVFNTLEWFLAAALVLGVICSRARLSIAAGLAAALLVLAETVWLLPLLDERVGLIIAGHQPPASNLHVVYIVTEVLKLAALGVVAADTARHLRRQLQQATAI